MRSKGIRRTSPVQILIHLFMAPVTPGGFSWEMQSDQMNRLAEDLRWTVLRKIFVELKGATSYRAFLQKHSIRVDSLDVHFFKEILEVVRENGRKEFNLFEARELSDLECLEKYFIPVILQWAESERSVSVSQEKTPSIEELISHEDSSGNVYQRFPDEFAWVLKQNEVGREKEERTLPPEMIEFTHRVASALTKRLKELLKTGKYDKYIILMSRLEDSVCTWDMTFQYLNELGMNKYSSWKSLSVVANRVLKDYVDGLPGDVKIALHLDDPKLSKEEKHDRLRMAVSAAIELDPVPSPKELMNQAG